MPLMAKADLILQNARIVTGHPGRPEAHSLAVSGDKILGLSAAPALPEMESAATRLIDLGGSTVVPGFNDAHCHIFSHLWRLLGVDLSPAAVASIDDIKQAIRRRAGEVPPGGWITATGYNEFYLAERRHPNRRDLDEAAPAHPVLLAHRSLHACVLNSRALRLAGIDAGVEAPPGATIDRELPGGEPSGLLYEMLGDIRRRVVPEPDEEEKRRAMRRLNDEYLAGGITSAQDATITNDFPRWQALADYQAAGILQLRLAMMAGYDAVAGFRERGMVTGYGDSMLRLGAVKFMLTETSSGTATLTDFQRQMETVHEAGCQIAIHAVEESAVRAAVTALEALPDNSPARRHRLEHCSECPPELVPRLRRGGILVVSQPPFLYYHGERYLATVAAPKQPWLYPFRSWIEGGVSVAASSDSPVAAPDPMIGIYAAVTRQEASGQTLSPAERITAAQALAMYTVNAAYTTFEENIKGTLAPGRLADLAVLSGNPLETAPARLKDIRVLATIIGGRVVWET